MKIIAISILICFGSSSFAAIPPQVKKTPAFFQTSSATKGGNFRDLQSVLDIRHTAASNKKVERIVIDLGTRDGKQLMGEVGYYHAEYKKEQNALIIDLAQTPISNISPEQFKARLKASHLIKSANMILDPVTNNMNLSLRLVDEAKPRVFRAIGKKTASKIVIDVVRK